MVHNMDAKKEDLATGAAKESIDDILKESEALLDRLQFSDDVFDGGSSLGSIGSTSQWGGLSSVAGTGAVVSPDQPPNGTEPVKLPPAKLPPTPEEAPASKTSPLPAMEIAEKPPPSSSSSSSAAKWEKVSSAAMGDDDYVPIVDYTKEKRTDGASKTPTARTKVSRLEAYREKARRRRKRRRRMGAVVAGVLAIVLWVWMRGRNGSVTGTDNEIETDLNSTNNNNTLETNETTFQPTFNETIPEEDCPRNFKAELTKILEESLCVPPQVVMEPPTTKEQEDITTKGNATIENQQITTQKPCKNIFARIFNKKCRKIARERRKKRLEQQRQKAAAAAGS